MILEAGIGDLAVADSKGIVHVDRAGLNDEKRLFANISNKGGLTGTFLDALVGADVFIGLSSGNVPVEAVASMAPDSIIFAMANPEPEVHPDVAHAVGRAVVATGRSDFPNQINNVLAFPGVFKGAMSVRASRHHRGHEAGRVRGARRRRRRRPVRGLRDPVGVRPAGRACGGRRRRGRRPRRRRRPPLRVRLGSGACLPSPASPSPPTTR